MIQALVALVLITLSMRTAQADGPPRPLAPTDLVASPDGKTLYVALHDAVAIAVVDPAQRTVLKTIPCPAAPNGLCLLDQGRTLAIACGGAQGVVALLDPATGSIARTLPAGHSPRAPVASPDGKTLYVCSRFDSAVRVLDLAAGREVARVPVLREPFDAVLTPDGKSLLVTNLLPEGRSDRGDSAAAITRIDTATLQTHHLRLPAGSTSVRGIALTPDGRFALATHILARYTLPTSQLERGWMNTNALSVVDLTSDRVAATVLLDEIDRGAASPWDVAVTADGARIVVSHAGTHELSVIDAPGLLRAIEAAAAAGTNLASDLGALVDLRRRLPLNPDTTSITLNGPRGLALVGDTAHVAVAYSDALAAVPIGSPASEAPPAASAIPLGPTPPLTAERLGERVFHDATVCFQGWQSCASCHPDARVDGLDWDLLNDSLGNPKNTKSMLLAHRTPPSMFLGVRADAEAAVRAGFRHILFSQPTDEEARAVDAYLKALEPEPSPHLDPQGRLTPEAERGRALFAADRLHCASCHPAPFYTDLRMHAVASRGPRDRQDDFDTPTLVELWRTAPYLHDGRHATLEDLFREGRHGLPSGPAPPLADTDLADLIAYLRSL